MVGCDVQAIAQIHFYSGRQSSVDTQNTEGRWMAGHEFRRQHDGNHPGVGSALLNLSRKSLAEENATEQSQSKDCVHSETAHGVKRRITQETRRDSHNS